MIYTVEVENDGGWYRVIRQDGSTAYQFDDRKEAIETAILLCSMLKEAPETIRVVDEESGDETWRMFGKEQ